MLGGGTQVLVFTSQVAPGIICQAQFYYFLRFFLRTYEKRGVVCFDRLTKFEVRNFNILLLFCLLP